METFYFSHARTALKYGIMALGLKKDDAVLLPEYICGDILHPIKELNMSYDFYMVNKDLTPNWDDLNNKVTTNHKALLMVHYFGHAQNIDLFQSFCKTNNLFLIEDNAHGYGGYFQGIFMGLFGDVGIASPRKTLDLSSGGLLYINSNKANLNNNLVNKLPVYKTSTLKQRIRLILKRNKIIRLLISKYLNKQPIYWNPTEFIEDKIDDYKIDPFSELILNNCNLNYIQLSRYNQYKMWESFLIKNGLTPVFEKISITESLLAFPAYTKNKDESKKWFDWGWQRGINVYSWPTLPLEIINKNDYSLRLWESMVCFSTEKYNF